MAFVPVYILILIFTIVIDYFAGISIERFQGKRRKLILLISLIANIGVLVVFKYYNFAIENISVVLRSIGLPSKIPYLSILLPIGLSFHTFQAMSYTIEVYRGNQKAEKHFGIYALYVMFYPQLVAGPIERPQNVLHQFYEKKQFNYYHVSRGLKLMLWGLFKKVVIADRLSVYVDTVFNHVGSKEFGSPTYVLAAVLFSIQIYCDFSGYSDMALGAAEVMGFKLMKNFSRPYFAKSIREFWTRWHISLSTWFRDYVYFPLGGNRVSLNRWIFNLFVVFLLSGLWHGANWTYIVWGALHGVFMGINAILSKLKKAKTSENYDSNVFISFLKMAGVFILVSFAWVFFRANTMNDAIGVFKNILHWKSGLFLGPIQSLIYSFAGLLILIAAEAKQEFFNKRFSISQSSHTVIRWAYCIILIFMILSIGVFNGSQFIYFQF
ncbi:MBOAT family O-acyltransferase [Mucilaginibacter sp. KACC 22063]|uniref:MBOAT family O-acyltransferase n=1 Tax=Mucilaginibacter sp. KACC 22063 TaxID=3025666 RepID=UPI0023671908|nr:MBOAT family O-acyltransferase [Mucilaginibacter sp. KACC 22063]WDF57134.1 MBOAT family protein [Mucilaginibacter sp. KACC 22063]